MELQHLIYTGSKSGGTLIVKQVHALSPFRKLNYGPGISWRIGIDLPDNVARHVVASYPTLFAIETEDLSSEDVFKMQIETMRKNFKDVPSETAIAIVSEVFQSTEDSPPRRKIRRKKTERSE